MLSKDFAKDLIDKLNDKTAVISVIGLGYVGLPLCLTYVENGFRVLGFDINEEIVEKINNGTSYIKHIKDERIAAAIKQEKFRSTL